MKQFIEGYYISKNGEVFKKINTYARNVGKKQRKRLVVKIGGKQYGIAKLVSENYVENTYNLPQIVFIDNNPLNCSSENIKFVSNQNKINFTRLNNPQMNWGGGIKTDRKKYKTVEQALEETDNYWLRSFYETRDIKYINELFIKSEKEIFVNSWQKIRGEVYERFVSLCQRNMMRGNPIAYIIKLSIVYNKKYWAEIKLQKSQSNLLENYQKYQKV